MKRSMFLSSSSVLLVLSAGAASCSSESDDTSNTAGGSSGSAGKAGSGGTGFAGGGGTGGAGATGGSGAVGGSAGRGGTAGTTGSGGSGGGVQMCPKGTLAGKSCMDIRTEFPNLGPCDQCLLTAGSAGCCTQTEACLTNANCAGGFNECINQRCATAADRVACGDQQCGVCLADQSVRDIVTALRTCGSTTCASACSGAPPADAGRD
jgi:hypothetical protein